MALVFQWKGDGLLSGTLTTSTAGTGDTAPSQINLSGSTASVAVTSSRSPGLQLQEAAVGSFAWVDWNVTPSTTAALRLYYTPTSVLASNHTIFSIRDEAETRIADINITATGLVQLYDVSNTLIAVAPDATIAVNSTYRFELTIDTITGVFDIAIYSGHSTTAIVLKTSVTGNFVANSVGCVRIGKNTTTQQAETQLWDDIVFTTDQVFIGSADTVPTVSLGPDLVQIEPFKNVPLSATVTAGTIGAWVWTQIAGPAVTLAGTGASRTFVAPALLNGIVLQFRVTGDGTATDTISVTINPHLEWLKTSGSLAALHNGLLQLK